MSSFIRLIAVTPELQTYAVQKLYAALKRDISQEALNVVGSWVIGEFGDALLQGGQYDDDGALTVPMQSDIVDLFATILQSNHAGTVVTEYIITSAMKLTTRLTEAAQIERLRRLLETYEVNLDVEIQQRAVEYSGLFGYDKIRKGVLERMPAPEIPESQRVLGEATTRKKRVTKPVAKKKPSQITEQDILLDLMGDNPLPAVDTSATLQAAQSSDLLADIMGGSPTITSTAKAASNNMSSIMDLFGDSAPNGASSINSNSISNTASQPAAQQSQPHSVYDKSDLNITFTIQRSSTEVKVSARFRNDSMTENLSAVSLQAAVPKSLKLQLQQISSSELEAGQDATQQMKIVGAQGVSYGYCVYILHY